MVLSVKRAFDIVFSLLGLLLVFPVLGITAALIRVRLGSPVLFKQQRAGLYGRPFCVYKFRTMTDEKDSQENYLPDYIRLTPFGKFLRNYSLDELPQLFNVIKGELSLVGPRPLLLEYLPLYNEEQLRRHQVCPGITGWAQVNGRNAISWEEKFRLDVWYVDNRNFWLDLKILWLTFLKVVMSEGINQQGSVTMKKFRGAGV